jgi:rubredoxin
MFDRGMTSTTHFHEVDQFQIIVAGNGRFGRDDVSPYFVHFSRAYTAYGPLNAGPEEGLTFMTLRSRFDRGAQRLPANYQRLKEMQGRRPWQISRRVNFPTVTAVASFERIAGMENEEGLSSFAMSVAPDVRAISPDVSSSGGQYVVALEGSWVYDGTEQEAMTVAFLKPNEGAFELQAGPQGLKGLVLNFPRASAQLKAWQCKLCGFVYEETVGIPNDRVPVGSRWQDVPENWTCPDCGARKVDFEVLESQPYR